MTRRAPRLHGTIVLALALAGMGALLASSAAGQASTPSFFKSFDPSTIAPGANSTLTFQISNVQNSAPASDLAFTDTLPAAVVIATPSAAATDCTDGILSAPAGGTTITFSGGRIGIDEACTITVNVTSSTPGTHTNISGDLTSSLGNSGPAQADLTVDATLPGFSKSFSPSSIVAGQRSTLTFAIVNPSTTSLIFSVAFSDALPTGLVIASDTLPTNSCGGSLTATPGSSSVSLAGGFVPASSSCEVSVDVIALNAGAKENVSSNLTSSAGTSGKAAATLTVGADVIRKSFLDDPVLPGDTVTLEFTISNVDRADSATNIAFTDDLDATLTGLTATALPADPCGAGSQISGTSTLTLSGGTLPPGGSCTFEVTLQVPAGATPGTYTNTTSAISMDVGGTPVTGPAAVDDLSVSAAPRLEKEFLTDPVAAGGTTTIRFTLTNLSATEPASAISFTDDLNAFLSGAQAISLGTNFCNGTGVMNTSSGVISVSNVSLAAGTSCTFDVSVAIPSGGSGGTFLNTAGPVTADVGGTVVLGGTASDSLTVAAAPQLTKSFIDDPVNPGDPATLRFTLELGLEAPGDATGIAFTDDLDAALSGLVATGPTLNDVCGAGSQISGTSSLTFTGGSISLGTSCTFDVPVQVPAGAPGGFHTNTTSDVTATMLGLAVTGPPAGDDLQVIGLTLAKSFTDDPVFSGDTVTLEFTLNNPSATSTATNITFTDSLTGALPGLASISGTLPDVCGAGSQIIGTTDLTFLGGSLGPGTSCTFSVVLQVPSGTTPGPYPNTTSSVSAQIGGSPATLPAASDTLTIENAISISKSFLDDPGTPGGTLTLQFSIANAHPTDAATSVSFTDDLAAALVGMVAQGLPMNDVCGVGSTISGTSVLTLTGGTVAAAGSCTFDVTVQIPAGALPGSYVNSTSPVTATVGAEFATGAAATDPFSIEAAPDFTKSFIDDPALPGGTVTLRFTITNPGGAAMSGIGFTDDLAAALSGLVTTGLPASDVCGAGSQLSGTTLVTLTGGSLAGSASCTFDVVLQMPAAPAPGTYTNTTSAIAASVGGLPVIGSPASDDLVVVVSPTLIKSFLTDPVAPGGTTSLQFTISLDANSPTGATGIGFTDDLSAVAGVVATGLPVNDVCGTGSVLSGTTVVSLSGGSLAPSGTCTFAVPLQVPAAAPAGTYTNTTSTLSSTVSGVPLSGAPASDTLSVVIGPILTKQFLGDPVAPGDPVTLEFTITLTGASPGSATAITFTDDLGAILPGLAATGLPAANVCGAGSQLSGTTTLTLTGGTLAAGGTCTFSATLQVPPTATPSSVTNTTSVLAANILGSPVAGNAASDVLEIHGLTLTKTFLDDPIGIGTTTTTLRFTIANANATQTTTGIAFTDDLDAALAGMVATGLPLADVCGAGSQISGTDVLTFTGGSLAPGVPCTFDLTLQLPPISGTSTITNTTSVVTGTIGGAPVSSPPATDTLTIGVNIPTLDPRVLLLLGALLAAIAALKLTPRS